MVRLYPPLTLINLELFRLLASAFSPSLRQVTRSSEYLYTTQTACLSGAHNEGIHERTGVQFCAEDRAPQKLLGLLINIKGVVLTVQAE